MRALLTIAPARRHHKLILLALWMVLWGCACDSEPPRVNIHIVGPILAIAVVDDATGDCIPLTDAASFHVIAPPVPITDHFVVVSRPSFADSARGAMLEEMRERTPRLSTCRYAAHRNTFHRSPRSPWKRGAGSIKSPPPGSSVRIESLRKEEFDGWLL